MDNTQRHFVLSALVLILLGTVGGGIYAFKVEHETLLLLCEQYQSAFSSAAVNDLDAAKASLQHAEKLNYTYVRMIDAHTHIIKLATLLLLISFIVPLLNWKEKHRQLFSSTLLVGIIIFPLAVYLQTLVSGILFQGIAALGALLVILCMGVFVLSLFRVKISN